MIDTALAWVSALLMTALSLAFAVTYGEAIVRLMRHVVLP